MKRIVAMLGFGLIVACDQVQDYGGGPAHLGKGLGGVGAYTCKITDDVLNDPTSERPVCVTENYHCNALNGCADDHACVKGSCVCSDEIACGIVCEESSDCPSGYDCDVASGTCRDALWCISSHQCAAGTFCLPDDVKQAKICKPAGAKTHGESCSASAECASALCVTGVCIERCSANSDCTSGLECSVVGATESEDVSEPYRFVLTPGCVADTACNGCAADEYCRGGSCVKNCATSGDCSGANCTIESLTYTQDANSCASFDGLCSSTEVLASDYCLTYTPCYTDDACAAGYTCVDFSDITLKEEIYGLAFCGRLAKGAI